MSGHDAREVGLLRTLARGVESRPPMSAQLLTQEFLRSEGLAVAQPVEGALIVIRQFAGQAYSELLECLANRSPAMERGTIFDEVRTELAKFLVGYVGRDPSSVGRGNVTELHDHFDQWFRSRVVPYRVLLPCVISRWQSSRFRVGPAEFVFVDDVVKADFYPPSEDLMGRFEVDELLKLMKDTGGTWLARVSIDGCEQKRAKELAALATDLAIVAIQLAVPHPIAIRDIGRLYTHRGTRMRLTLSEAGGRVYADRSFAAPGDLIGPGVLAHYLQVNESVVAAVGNCVGSFSTGQFRLRTLEVAWCDAAYWLHQALAEPNDAIAVAKLETALEVLVRAENVRGSQARIESILETFYGLRPNDPLHDATVTTAKEFAKDLVLGRSQVLHGIVSTLNSRLTRNRNGAEEFALAVLRRAAVELDAYANSENAVDEIEGLLEWVKSREVSTDA